ncbi:FecCD family ABC transporter permease [Paracoccus xiamenensis]|uniref:FecCD family ABC transporter permease n=1 Tax=Paracoccus xiamenensis TaxID=2714901 RepID=UPI00140CCE84|nr:iron ABC transporter permease [Paracoccus xiamenensis]NHF74007.1 iron ABC transporter permease [Paracoccus xiamenensis]
MTEDILKPDDPAPNLRAAVLTAYERHTLRRVFIVAGLVAALVTSVLADLAIGASSLSLVDVVRAILWTDETDYNTLIIIWDVRMPAALMAVPVGMALSLAGAEMQTILNNPLASPFTLGVSAAAAFGAGLAIVLGLGLPGIPTSWLITVNAFAFAFGSLLLLLSLTRVRGAGVDSLVMFGIALGFTFSALLGLLQFVASADALQQLVFWTMGSLTRASWEAIAILAVVILLALPFSLGASWKLTALRLGDDRARSFGIDVTRLRFFSLLRISILAATSVAFVGAISFIGLVGPHIARLIIGEDHRFFLPASVLTGAVVMSLADIASKSIVPGVIVPVGIVTSLVGLPVFFSLILRRRERL